MEAIRGIYDGEKFVPLDNFQRGGKYKVIITFLEKFDEDEEIREFSARADAFSF